MRVICKSFTIITDLLHRTFIVSNIFKLFSKSLISFDEYEKYVWIIYIQTYACVLISKERLVWEIRVSLIPCVQDHQTPVVLMEYATVMQDM